MIRSWFDNANKYTQDYKEWDKPIKINQIHSIPSIPDKGLGDILKSEVSKTNQNALGEWLTVTQRILDMSGFSKDITSQRDNETCFAVPVSKNQRAVNFQQ